MNNRTTPTDSSSQPAGEAVQAKGAAELLEINRQLQQEIAKRRRAEKALRQRVEELLTLNQITQTMAMATHPPTILATVVESLTKLFGVQSTTINLYDPKRRAWRVAARYNPGSAGLTDPAGQSRPIDLAPIYSRLLETRQPLLIAQCATR